MSASIAADSGEHWRGEIGVSPAEIHTLFTLISVAVKAALLRSCR
jgi:hypothetical protein